jgi:outer membrane receptor for ferric coprogen and ferric-rhodotorulic acid
VVVTSRGFQIDDWQYDGVPIQRNNYSLGNWATQDLVFFDRVEVLRGASGLLQGTRPGRCDQPGAQARPGRADRHPHRQGR